MKKFLKIMIISFSILYILVQVFDNKYNYNYELLDKNICKVEKNLKIEEMDYIKNNIVNYKISTLHHANLLNSITTIIMFFLLLFLLNNFYEIYKSERENYYE